MITARDYARALIGALEETSGKEHAARLARFLAHIKRVGHTRLLPRIVRAAESELAARAKGSRATVSVAREKDAAAHRATIHADAQSLGADPDTLAVVVDPGLVGGYRIKTRNRVLDKSMKRTLADLYRRMLAEPLS